MEIVKNVSTRYADLGEVIVYSLQVTNTGDSLVEDIVISDPLDEQLEFMAGSIRVDNVHLPSENIISGIHIGMLPINASRVVNFKAKIISKHKSCITSIARGSYIYRGEDDRPRKENTESNEVQIQVSYPYLKVHKKSDIDFAVLNDEITYTVTITNEGDLNTCNVIFKDELPKEVVLVPRSFSIDGHIINEVDIEKGIIIGDISTGCHIVIQYKVIVVSTNCKREMKNEVSVKFNYTLPDGRLKEMVIEDEKGTSVIVTLAISNFKQMSIESHLPIPDLKPDMEEINSITGTIDIVNYHIIQTPQIISREGQQLTGYKLIVRGVLQLFIEYTALGEHQCVHSAYYAVPFSTFVVLPPNYKMGSKIEVEGKVEDIYYKVLDIRRFFANTTAFIQVKIVGY